MNNRLTIQDLAGLLAEYTGKDKNSSERFLREFIAVVSEGVYTDKLVKVRGLGTFKIIPVEKRESIHVNTGERFVIPEHYKFSFLPDNELGENVDFTDMDIVSDEPEIKETEDESVEEVIPEENRLLQEEEALDTPEIQEASEDTGSQGVSETDEVSETPDILKPAESLEKTSETFEEAREIPVVDQPVCSVKEEEDEVARYSETSVGVDMSRNKLKLIIWVIVIFLACFGLCLSLNVFFFSKEAKDMLDLKKKVADWKNRAAVGDSISLREDTVVVRDDAAPLPEDTLSKLPDMSSPETEEPVLAPHAGSPDTKVKSETASPKVIARVKIEPGSRLTLISLKYYGSKLFWVYLYEYNKAIIKDPNNVPIGTVIEVPAPETYGIDRRDRSSVEKAAARQTEILSGKL